MRLCEHAGVTPGSRLAALERAYLAAREAHDELDVARGTGDPADPVALESVLCVGGSWVAPAEKIRAGDWAGIEAAAKEAAALA